MKVIVKDENKMREDIQAKKTSSICIITIANPEDTRERIETGPEIKGILELYFDDVEFSGQKGLPMTKDDAEKIVKFVKKCQKVDIDELWVCCPQGVARSAGVAAAISKYLYNDDSDIFNEYCLYPNMYCYKTTLDAFFKKNK